MAERHSEIVRTHRLANGLTILMERMPHLKSAAFTLLLPAGTVDEPLDRSGLAAITMELMQRGAGPRSSRQIIEDLDFYGIERDSGMSVLFSTHSAAMIDRYLEQGLEIYADIVQRPQLAEDQLEDARASSLQELAALQDEPMQRCLITLRKLRYGHRFGRSPYGDVEGVEAVTIDDVREYFATRSFASGCILSIAGHIDFDRTIAMVERLFGEWQSGAPRTATTIQTSAGYDHLNDETSQTHITMAYDAVPYDHEKYYESRALINILGDGMSSRLFHEVRESRGLAYSVAASPQSIGTCSSAFIYAGTTSARADETLQVINQTIGSLSDGINEDELRRLKSRVKSSLVFEQESCTARASQNAADWLYLGRVVDRREVVSKVDALTIDCLKQYAIDFPPRNQTLVTLGEKQLESFNAV
jgi:predicted Zn-dependent peptidase